MLYHLGAKIKPQINHHIPLLVKYIVSNKLDTTLRVDKALEYTLSHLTNLNSDELEKYCGVGIVVSPEDIEKIVEKYISQVKADLLEKRYNYNVGLIMQKVRNELPWADGKSIKNEVDVQVIF